MEGKGKGNWRPVPGWGRGRGDRSKTWEVTCRSGLRTGCPRPPSSSASMLVSESISASRLPGRSAPLSGGRPWRRSQNQEEAYQEAISQGSPLHHTTPQHRHSHLRTLGCCMGPHPGRAPVLPAPVLATPWGLVTLVRREGAKIDPGVGLECWGGGERDQRWGRGWRGPFRSSTPSPGWEVRGCRSRLGGAPRWAPLRPSPAPLQMRLPYLFRGRVAAQGRPGRAPSLEGLWWSLAALGGARWAPTWSGLEEPMA